MSEKRVTQMDSEEFDAIIESYIERETREGGEVTAPLFYEALEEIFAAEPASETVELEGHVVGSKLQLHPAVREVPGVSVRDNEIVVNNIRFVIRLTPAKS